MFITGSHGIYILMVNWYGSMQVSYSALSCSYWNGLAVRPLNSWGLIHLVWHPSLSFLKAWAHQRWGRVTRLESDNRQRAIGMATIIAFALHKFSASFLEFRLWQI